MKLSQILTGLIVALFSLNTMAIDKYDLVSMDCKLNNAVGTSDYEYDSDAGILETSTRMYMNPFFPLSKDFRIVHLDADVMVGSHGNLEVGKIEFAEEGSRPGNLRSYMIVTTTPMERGTHTYAVTWSTSRALSVFMPVPVGAAVISSGFCQIEIQ